MFRFTTVLFAIIVKISANIQVIELPSISAENEVEANQWIYNKIKNNEPYFIEDNDDVVNIKVYYESLCPYCIQFITQQLQPVTQQLSQYLNIDLIPYGNAQTIENNGKYTFICQHGTDECYGNKLHACSIDVLKNSTLSTLFNACMMWHDSNDKALDSCGSSMNVDTSSIKECANSAHGSELLKKYGDETQAMKLQGVPAVLLNGSMDNEDTILDNLLSAVCKLLQNPPDACSKKYFVTFAQTLINI